MQFIDLAAQQKRIRMKLEERIGRVLDHGGYIMGPEIHELEEKLASYVGAAHAISCGSGTDALLMALMAYEVGPGQAVFTTPFTFIATAEVISLLGATPVFVDVDPVTFNMDPAALERAIDAVKRNDAALHPLPSGGVERLRPRGVIPVDLFGLPADYERINAIAKTHGLFVIQDAAQSFGAERGGKKSCSHAGIGCTSFFPAKPLGCYGDGGMCFTDDSSLAAAMRSVRVHGQGADKYDNVRIGINGRMDSVQAAVLLVKFEIFPEEVELRNVAASRYSELLASSGATPPRIPEGCKSVFAQYSVLARDSAHRAEFQTRLKNSEVPTAIYYPKPLHMQEAFGCLGYSRGDFPVSEECAGRIFSLPMHPYLGSDDQERIARVMRDVG